MAALTIIKTPLFELTPKLAPDRMKLFVDAKPCSPNVTVTRKDLLNAMKDVAKEEMFDLGVLDDLANILSRGEECTERRVAKGTSPIPGHNGRLALMVKPFTGKGAPRDTPQGTIDFRSLHLFDNVTENSIVGKIFPPTVGQDGIDATGKVLPAPSGKPEKIGMDKTLRLERPAGQELECLVANSHGYLFLDSGRFTVRDELKFPGDIDLATGSIDFIGTLVVGGDVCPGFFARARRGVIINGGARNAVIESAEGDIRIKGFVFGGQGARIVSSEVITINSAQEINIEARGDVNIEKHAIDCTIRALRSIVAPNASIVGGDSFAVCGGEIGELGNDAEKRSVFHLCNNVEADPEYTALLAKIVTHTKAIGMLEGHLGPYTKNPARIALLKSPFKGKMEELLRKLMALRSSLEVLESSKAKALASAVTNEVQRVNILKTAHAGAIIICDNEEFVLKDSIPGPISIDFDPATRKFSVGPLQPLLCTVSKPSVTGAQNGHKK